MTVQEAYVEWFEKPMRKYIKTNPKELIDFLANQQDILKIKERIIERDDIIERSKNPNYLSELIIIEDDVLIVNDLNNDVVNFIKNNISSTITTLDVPNTFFQNIEVLKTFSNLKKIIVKGYLKLSEEEIDFIKNETNITEIISESYSIVKQDYKIRPGEIFIKQPSEVFISGNLISRANKNNYPMNAIEGRVCGTKLDMDLITRAASNLIFKEDEPITRLTIKTDSLPSKKDENELLKLEFSEEGDIKLLKFNLQGDITDFVKIITEIEKTKKIQKIVLKCRNQSYENLYYLNPIAKKYDFEIDYGDLHRCSLEEFSAMRETLDWFNELINSTKLSPAEKLLFAYDIIKTFKYKENEENKNQARYLHNIIMSDYIVCVGYAKFMEQLLIENGIPAEEVSVSCNINNGQSDGHARTLVKLDDDKYDIHGVFCIDATWDSTKDCVLLVETQDNKRYVKAGITDGDKIERRFNAEDLYRNFLIPSIDYPKVYPCDSAPKIMEHAIEGSLDNINDVISRESIKELFGPDADMDDVKDYMRVKKPSLEVFSSMLYNVRIAQGYTEEEAKASVSESIELNQMIDELNRKEQTFFRSEQKK